MSSSRGGDPNVLMRGGVSHRPGSPPPATTRICRERFRALLPKTRFKAGVPRPKDRRSQSATTMRHSQLAQPEGRLKLLRNDPSRGHAPFAFPVRLERAPVLVASVAPEQLCPACLCQPDRARMATDAGLVRGDDPPEPDRRMRRADHVAPPWHGDGERHSAHSAIGHARRLFGLAPGLLPAANARAKRPFQLRNR